MKIITVLYARQDSIYKTFPECNVYDLNRDARTWPGGTPVIAHPPCAQWGQLRGMAKDNPEEKKLALHALEQVHRWGGILEHPLSSTLWLLPEIKNSNVGTLIPINQSWFGHRATKPTILYIVGLKAGNLPALPYSLNLVRHKINNMPKKERETTPLELAKWLVKVAQRTT